MGRKDGLERRVLPYGWSLWICPGVSFGDQFTAFCYSHTQLEGVCFCPEWSRLDSHVGAVRPRHVLWLALHKPPKLPHSFIIPVRSVRAWSDNSSEAAPSSATSFNSSGQDSCRICARFLCQQQSSCVKTDKIFWHKNITYCSHIVG